MTSSSVKAWFRLTRLPLSLTVGADLLAGAVLGGGEIGGWFPLAFISSVFLFTGGMILNDWRDLAADRLGRPSRPLPAGLISPALALLVGSSSLVLGVILPWLFFPPGIAGLWLIIAASVLLYDLGPRRLPGWSLVTMGLCRGFDLLAGSLAATGTIPFEALYGGGLFFLYSAMITLQAGSEGEVLLGRKRWFAILPLGPAILLFLHGPVFLPGLVALVLLVGETTTRFIGGKSILAAQQLTGAWVRGFLLLGGGICLNWGHVGPGWTLVLLWAFLSWSLRSREQS